MKPIIPVPFPPPGRVLGVPSELEATRLEARLINCKFPGHLSFNSLCPETAVGLNVCEKDICPVNCVLENAHDLSALHPVSGSRPQNVLEPRCKNLIPKPSQTPLPYLFPFSCQDGTLLFPSMYLGYLASVSLLAVSCPQESHPLRLSHPSHPPSEPGVITS